MSHCLDAGSFITRRISHDNLELFVVDYKSLDYLTLTYLADDTDSNVVLPLDKEIMSVSSSRYTTNIKSCVQSDLNFLRSDGYAHSYGYENDVRELEELEDDNVEAYLNSYGSRLCAIKANDICYTGSYKEYGKHLDGL